MTGSSQSSPDVSSLPEQAVRNASHAVPPPTFLLRSAIVVLGSTLFLIRLSGLPQVVENEWRLSAYALDVLQNGHWFCQTDVDGDLASKPPLLTWLVTLVALLTGRVGLFELHLPTALGAIATALILFEAGRVHFEWRAGLFAAFSYLACYAGYSQMATTRYDGLLAVFVTLSALAAHRGWETNRGWTWCWLWAAMGTLTKGPLALILPAGGLLAVGWSRRCGQAHPLRMRIWPGLGIFLLLTVGWFALAYAEVGFHLIDKMLRREFLNHAVGINESTPPLLGLPRPSLAFLFAYAPWSVASAAAVWRVFKKPSGNAAERRFERFILCWFVAGLVVFSVAAHQRGRLIYPLVPAAALLAGRELALWTSRWTTTTLTRVLAVCGCLVVAAAWLHSHVLLTKSHRAQRALAIRDLSQRLEALGPGHFPLTYMDSPVGLQLVLQNRQQLVSSVTAAELLSGAAAAFVVVSDFESLRKQLPRPAQVFEVFRWPAIGEAEMRIISNHPRLEWPMHTALVADGLRLEMDGAHLLQTRRDELSFEFLSATGTITVFNACPRTRMVKLHCLDRSGPGSRVVERPLAPGAVWREPLNHKASR